MNSKDTKQVYALLNKQFGFEKKLDYAFFKNEKNKVFIINKDIKDIHMDKLRVNSLGMYFCEFPFPNQIRLSIEGSQLIGNDCTTNIAELNEEEIQEWRKGYDLQKSVPEGFVIIKHKNNFYGCGKATKEKILNYFPKTRRIN